MENIRYLVLVDDKPEKVTDKEFKEVLKNNGGDLKRFKGFKDENLVWGYLCKVSDYFTYYLMDMDKVILFFDGEDYVYSYEPTGNYSPAHKEGKKVIGLMDENAEIEAIERIN